MTRRPAVAATPRRPTIILVAAMGLSVHTRRWLKGALNDEMRFVLLPVEHNIDAAADGLSPVRCVADAVRLGSDEVGVWSPGYFVPQSEDGLPPPLGYKNRDYLTSGAAIAFAVRQLKPDLVHSLEIQHAGYSCLAAARLLGAEFPRWLISNWGSDIFLYAKLSRHQPILAELMGRADAYLSECVRDVTAARQMGFHGQVLAPLPASGGMHQAQLPTMKPPSERSEILVKGYHGWSGRGLHILSALHIAAPELRKFLVTLRHASPAIEEMVAALRNHDGLEINVLPFRTLHEESMEDLARARLSVSLGISGGIDTTMLESMSLGVFPITTCATCAREWLEPGRDGFIVEPHDVSGLARAIMAAAQDDALVDTAAVRNREQAHRRWDATVNSATIQNHYRAVLTGIIQPEGAARA